MELVEWADQIKEEILADEDNGWYWPNNSDKKIFDQAYMKFVNRNLNYYYFPNMLYLAYNREHQFNPSFKVTLDFCNYAREFNNNLGPFGRMCIWKLPPKTQLLPHRDDFKYHNHIARNIFVISDNTENLFRVNIKEEPVPCVKGTFFQFHPYTDIHEFINESEESMYFLGFDYWYLDKLSAAAKDLQVGSIDILPYQRKGQGGRKTKKLYLSPH
jgi:hypothetical protein